MTSNKKNQKTSNFHSLTSDRLKELQADLPTRETWYIDNAMRNAGSCETGEDFEANTLDAITHAETLLEELRDLLKRGASS